MNRLQVLAQNLSQKSPYTKLVLQKDSGIATIWLNSLKDLNCLSLSMSKQIQQALAELDQDQTVKIVLIRSKHTKIFCAGADIKNMKDNDYSTYPHKLHFLSIERAFRHFRKPIVAVVEGKALGGGFQLALLTDIIVVSPHASFGLPEITLGLIPGIGGTQHLTRIVGPMVATKMILAGQLINAEQADRLKIASLIPSKNFESDLAKFVDNLVNRPMDSLELAKRSIKFSQQATLEQGLDHQMMIAKSLEAKDSPLQGVMAFIEKREPNFRNV